MSQATIHHPSSYGYSGQVGLPATVTGGVSATFSWQNLTPTTGYTVTWGGGAPATDTFTSDAAGAGSAAHTYANGTYTQTVTNTATGQIVAKRTFTVPYAGPGGFAPRMAEGGGEEGAGPQSMSVDNGNGDYFDPADYSIPEVLSWAEENPDQLDNLIEAEEAGKARVTLLAQLNDMR